MMLSSVTIDYADNGGDDDEIDSKIANKMCFFFHSKNKVFRTIIGRQLSLRKTVQRGKLSVKKLENAPVQEHVLENRMLELRYAEVHVNIKGLLCNLLCCTMVGSANQS